MTFATLTHAPRAGRPVGAPLRAALAAVGRFLVACVEVMAEARRMQAEARRRYPDQF